MRPTVCFARADGIPLRLLYLFASAGKAYSAGVTGNRHSLMKGWRSGACGNRQTPFEEGRRSGTHHYHYPKTDVVVTIVRMIVVTIDSPRVVMIVDPRAAPQVRRSEPHSLRCEGIIHGRSKIGKFLKRLWRGAGATRLRFAHRPHRDQREGGRPTHTTRKPIR